MSKIKLVLLTTIVTLTAFITTIYVSCKKDPCSGISCLNGGTCSSGSCKCPSTYTGLHCETLIPVDPCASVTCLNGGACNNGVCACPMGYHGVHCENTDTSSFTYTNDTYTPINITLNGITHIIPAGGSVVYPVSYGTSLRGTASTCGTTTSGSQVGLLITWNIADTFSFTNETINLDISSSYFYLKINNNSAYAIATVYVNYGLTTQTTDYVTIPNDGFTYGIGYYDAFVNSNLRLLSSGGSYYWSYNITLPFTTNQSYTFTAL